VKTLHILRHAKSETVSGGDHERKLAERGIAACALIGHHLGKNEVRPGHILCSTAARARETIAHVAAAASWNDGEPAIEFAENLYMASGAELLAIAWRTVETCDSLMLVGHNPGMEEAARMLVSDGAPEALAWFEGKYSTGAIATIDFDVELWREIGVDLGYLSGFVKPRMLAKP